MEQRAPKTSSATVSIGDLAEAFGNNELAVHYQPIMHLVDEAVVGFEALPFWPHDRPGLLDAGLRGALNSWILTTACDRLAEWQRDVLVGPGFHMSVNISGSEVDGHGLVERVDAALGIAGASAKGLVLEVTDTIAIPSIDAARRSFEGLHALGVELALDDFGTSRTTSSCLRSLPFDIVKLDRELVLDSHTKNGKASIRALVELSRHLGTRLVAQGVETTEQAAVLRGLGCEEGQGRLWAAGLPVDGAERLLCCPVRADIASWRPAP